MEHKQMKPKSTDRPASPAEELWTAEQVARFLGVPVSTLYRWRCFGEGPPAYRVGRHLRYDPVELQLWLDEKPA
jgi:predicted DNA-binding transcriptional regulator AlpA